MHVHLNDVSKLGPWCKWQPHNRGIFLQCRALNFEGISSGNGKVSHSFNLIWLSPLMHTLFAIKYTHICFAFFVVFMSTILVGYIYIYVYDLFTHIIHGYLYSTEVMVWPSIVTFIADLMIPKHLLCILYDDILIKICSLLQTKNVLCTWQNKLFCFTFHHFR